MIKEKVKILQTLVKKQAGTLYPSWQRFHFKVKIKADRLSPAINYYQGFEDFDEESFLDCIINDIVAVMQYGDTLKSLCENYLILACGMEEGSKAIATGTLMKENYRRIKYAFYNTEDFENWVAELAEKMAIIE